MRAFRKIGVVLFLWALGACMFGIPLIGLMYCLSKHKWIEGFLCLCVLLAARKIFFHVEKRIGIYSKTSPLGRKKGAGVTIYAPWVKK